MRLTYDSQNGGRLPKTRERNNGRSNEFPVSCDSLKRSDCSCSTGFSIEKVRLYIKVRFAKRAGSQKHAKEGMEGKTTMTERRRRSKRRDDEFLLVPRRKVAAVPRLETLLRPPREEFKSQRSVVVFYSGERRHR